MSPAQLGVELRARRIKAGLSQAELAEAIGTSQPAVARVEAGGVVPSWSLVDRWATATGFPVTLGAVAKPLTAQQKQRVTRQILGENAFDPWERLNEKQARGMNVEPERRYLMSILPNEEPAEKTG